MNGSFANKIFLLFLAAVSLIAVIILATDLSPISADVLDPSMTPYWCGGTNLPTCEPTYAGTLVKNYWATLSAIPPGPTETIAITTQSVITTTQTATVTPFIPNVATPTSPPFWYLLFPFLQNNH